MTDALVLPAARPSARPLPAPDLSLLTVDSIKDYGTALWEFQQLCVGYLKPQPYALIGDEMGLGKTRQAMARDYVLRSHRDRSQDNGTIKTLVVCPKSVIPVWSSHYKELVPGAVVYDDIADSPKTRADFANAVKKGVAHVYITHWEAVRALVGNDAAAGLERYPFFHIIIDECQRMKNRKAQQTVALKRLRTTYKTALSGTPADNKPQDFWCVLNWLWPNLFRGYWSFYKHHVVTQTDYDRNGRAFQRMINVANKDELQAKIRPFYVRRKKEDVLKDLPAKYYSTYEVELSLPQRRAYNEMKKNMLAWIGEHENEPVAAPMVIAQLTRLQQFAGAYARLEERMVRERNPNFDPELPAVTYESLKDLPPVLSPEWTSLSRAEKKALQNYKMKMVMKKFLLLDEPSTKLDLLMELLKDNEDDQFVVFSQSRQLINLFGKRLVKADIPHGLLTGDTKQADRGTLVEDFQAKKLRVFAGTIAAGGVGITLTSASRVVFLDRAWSPALNLQAEDRLHRIGQKNAVQVIDIIARNTIDLGRNQQIAKKWEWLKEILGDTVDRPKLLGELVRDDDVA